MSKILTGFTEYFPSDQLRFDRMINSIIEVYKDNNYYNMDTPILESTNNLLKKSNGETTKQVYSFTKGTSDITMRYDLTVPLALYVSRNKEEISFPFKRYQLGKVYRGEKKQKGRYREFYQLDIDIIDRDSLSIYNDCEILAIAYKALKSVTNLPIIQRVNHRALLDELLNYFNLDKDKIYPCLDDFYKTPLDIFTKNLTDLSKSDIFVDLIKCNNLNKIIELPNKSDLFNKAISEVQLVLEMNEYAVFDITIVRGLDYYTGIVFETFIADNISIGSICSGGRYDNLTELYDKQKFPGIGMSIGVTRLFDILRVSDDNIIEDKTLIIPLDNKYITYCKSISDSIPKSSIYYEARKLKKAMKYAENNRFTKVIVIGEDEFKESKYLIKEMSY